MKLNSNKAFNLLGIVCMVVLIGALMLAGWAGLSMTGIIVTGIVVAAIGNFVAIILLTKYSSEREEPADGFHLDEVRVPRTALSTGIEIITDQKKAGNADVVLLCVGEQAYAEWNGDTEDLELCGELGLPDNRKAILVYNT